MTLLFFTTTTTKRIKQTTCFLKIIQIKCKNNKNGGKIKIVHKNKMKNCAIRVYSAKKGGRMDEHTIKRADHHYI